MCSTQFAKASLEWVDAQTHLGIQLTIPQVFVFHVKCDIQKSPIWMLLVHR